ncbi:MAG: right-handed parallel beta-helix repeat-containing protein [Chloroflexaceae bacterium]|nr:right-handed parallel beta-helix repeat-containing protein [Chloroflexaceae bacterium]
MLLPVPPRPTRSPHAKKPPPPRRPTPPRRPIPRADLYPRADLHPVSNLYAPTNEPTPPTNTEETEETEETTPTPEESPTPTPTPGPTEPPIDILSGSIRWNSGQGPVVLENATQIAPGSVLIIDPGVEVRLGWGASLTVDHAQIYAIGTPGQPVRFVGHTDKRWQGIFSRNNSLVVFEHAEIRDGGAGGAVIVSEGGELVVRNSRIIENGGTILTTDSTVEVRDSEIWGNDLPYGGAFNATYTSGNLFTFTGNRVGKNRLSDGASSLTIENHSEDTVVLDIQSNHLDGYEKEGANLLISASGAMEGTIACNSLIGADTGLRLRTETPQLPHFNLSIANNRIDNHVPPVVPYYVKYGIGRGATSEILLDMRQNWWGERSGPYHPDENPEGRGDSVGNNILYRPWLTEPPPCVPWP